MLCYYSNLFMSSFLQITSVLFKLVNSNMEISEPCKHIASSLTVLTLCQNSLYNDLYFWLVAQSFTQRVPNNNNNNNNIIIIIVFYIAPYSNLIALNDFKFKTQLKHILSSQLKYISYIIFHTFIPDSSALAVGGLSKRGGYYITMHCHSPVEK